MVATDTDRYSADDADLKHGLGRIGHMRNKDPPLDLKCPSNRSYEYGTKVMSNAYLRDGACVPEESHL